MRVTNTILCTSKNTPNDASLVSHQLMIKSGMIQQIASGIYMWLPTGLKVLRNIEKIVRKEMDNAGVNEILMSNIIPAELIKETTRWDKFGGELLKITDRKDSEFCFGPTHEEVVTNFARNYIKSYKQLPINFYQIQTKFRDEIRPRFGVMRSREFIMKDAYSFDVNKDGLDVEYKKMYDCYVNIFNKIGLKIKVVDADSGAIGGEKSQEFHVIAKSGEDDLFYSDTGVYAANIEKATCSEDDNVPSYTELSLEIFDTGTAKTINDLEQQFNIDSKKVIKTIIVKNTKGNFFALALRGDHNLNETKISHLKDINDDVTFASDDEVFKIFNVEVGNIGVVNCPIPLIIDKSALNLNNFYTGGNKKSMHYKNVNWNRDVNNYKVEDIRNVVVGDKSPDGNGILKHAKGIEVGHIFQLGDNYTKAMNASVLDKNGKSIFPQMGCYGLGISRLVAATIEQSHDDNGIIWPDSIAPYTVVIVPMNMYKCIEIKEFAENLYTELKNNNIEVLFNDRNERAGIMFADADLIGIPHRIVVGNKSLKDGNVEYKSRCASDKIMIKCDEIIDYIVKKVS